MALINRILDWFKSLFWKEEMELTLVGLQYSGKTTFVNVIAVCTAIDNHNKTTDLGLLSSAGIMDFRLLAPPQLQQVFFYSFCFYLVKCVSIWARLTILRWTGVFYFLLFSCQGVLKTGIENSSFMLIMSWDVTHRPISVTDLFFMFVCRWRMCLLVVLKQSSKNVFIETISSKHWWKLLFLISFAWTHI